jgi:hypothetical protein
MLSRSPNFELSADSNCAPAYKESQNPNHQEHKKQNLGNTRGRSSDSAETEQCRDKRDH